MKRRFLNYDEREAISAQNPFRKIREDKHTTDNTRKYSIQNNMNAYSGLKHRRSDEDNVWLD